MGLGISLSYPSRLIASGVLPPSAPVPDFWLIGDSAHFQDTGRTTSTVANGDPIGSATDVATTGPFHPSQATGANQPTLATNLYKGHSGIAYSATQNLTHAAAPLANSRTKGTLMCAFRSDTPSPPGGSIFSTTQEQLSFLAPNIVSLNTADAKYGTMAASGSRDAMLQALNPQIVTVIYDGTQADNPTRLRMWRNLIEEALTYTDVIPASTLAGGQGLFLGRQAGGSGWAHTAMQVIFWRAVALTTGERQAWENYLATLLFTKTTKGVMADGDSNSNPDPTRNNNNPWSQRVKTALGYADYHNSASFGKTMATIKGTQLGWRDDWLLKQPFLLMGGINDVATDVSAATLQGYFTTWTNTARQARFTMFVSTILPYTALTGAQETVRTTVNTWLRGGNLGGDVHLVDVEADSRLNPVTATYYGDASLHLNDAGHQVMADLFTASLQAAGY